MGHFSQQDERSLSQKILDFLKIHDDFVGIDEIVKETWSTHGKVYRELVEMKNEGIVVIKSITEVTYIEELGKSEEYSCVQIFARVR